MSLTASEIQLLRGLSSSPSARSSASPRRLQAQLAQQRSELESLSASVSPSLRGYVMAAAKPVAPGPEPPSHAGERTILANAFANGIRQFIAFNSVAGVQSAAELAKGYLQAHNLVRAPEYMKIQAALAAGYDDVIRPAFAEFLMAYIHSRFTSSGASRASNYSKSGMDIHAAQGIYSLLMSPDTKKEKISTQDAIDLAFALLPVLTARSNWFGRVIDRAVMLGTPVNTVRKLYEIDAMPPIY